MFISKLFTKSRRGATLVETVIALTILSGAVIVMARITSLKIAEQATLDSQYIIINADSVLSDIYHSFHKCSSFTAVTDDETKAVMLTFTHPDNTVDFYEYTPLVVGGNGELSENGVKQVTCTGFEATGAGNSLQIVLRLPGQKNLSMDIFK